MKSEYNIKDQVWIHIGERSLREGRVVDVFDLSHIDENNTAELYVIEVDTPVEKVYEVRSFEQISPTPGGPINLFKNLSAYQSGRFFGKIGMPLPEGATEPEEAIPLSDTGTKPKPRKKYYRSKK